MKKRLLSLLLILLILLGSCTARAETVSVYRSLCVGISFYADGRTRQGGRNSVQGVYDALARAFGGHNSVESTLLMDLTREELLLAIEDTFREADENDVSILYLGGHGGAQGGISWVETADNDVLTAGELERVTRSISGRVILFIDCCNSGSFIGENGFSEGFERAFSMNSFSRDKYLVLTSCAGDENSYRVTSGEMTEESMSTAFSRALCEGLGWNLITDKSISLRSDKNRDRMVNFTELVLYTRERTMYYLYGSGIRQSVCAFPDSDAFLLASRR